MLAIYGGTHSSTDNQMCCIVIGGYGVFGPTVGSDFYVVLCIYMPPKNTRTVRKSGQTSRVRSGRVGSGRVRVTWPDP